MSDSEPDVTIVDPDTDLTDTEVADQTTEPEDNLPEVTIVDPEKNTEEVEITGADSEVVTNENTNVNASVNNISNVETNDEFGEIVEVDDIEAVPESEREVDKEIFMRVMEEDMLRDVPVALQNNIGVQERIRKQADDLWRLKEKSDRVLAQKKAGEVDYRPLVDSLDQGYFHLAPWVFPVVLDIHNIYALRCQKSAKKEENENNDDENEEEFTGEVQFGDKMENQIAQMKEVQTLLKKLYEGDINYVSYASGSTKALAPYQPMRSNSWAEAPLPMPKARKLRLRSFEQLVRFVNLKKKPKVRVGRAPWTINIYVPEKRKKAESLIEKVQTERKVMSAAAGEEVQIGGFLVLPLPPRPTPEQVDDMIKKALERETVIKNMNSVKQVDPNEPQLLLFESGTEQDHEISVREYSELLRKLAPTSEQVVEYALRDLTEPDNASVAEEVKHWGMEVGDILSSSWQKARDAIAKTAQEDVPKSITGIPLKAMSRKCDVTGEDYLVRNDVYRKKFMRSTYDALGYTDDLTRDYRGPDCVQHRVARLYNTVDNGSFFYTYSFLHQKRPSQKKELERLARIQKQFVAKQKELSRNARGNASSVIEFPKEENGSFNLVKARDAFKKLMAVPRKTLEARKQLPELEKMIESVIEAQKKLKDQKAILDKSVFRKAGRLFLYKMGDTAAMIKKGEISEAELGRIMFEKEQRNRNKELDEENSKPKFAPLLETEPVIDSLLQQINKLDTVQEKNETIYSIIEQDGMMIDKFIYSVRFRTPMFCGHWYYAMLADRAVAQKEREQWVRQLLSIFGSDNRKEGSYNCMVCGAYLDRTSFFEPLHFDQYGLSDRRREAYVAEQRHVRYLHSQEAHVEDTISMSVKLCRGALLKSEIMSRGLKEAQDTQRAVQACEILDRFLAKTDIYLTPKQFLGIILVSVQDSKMIADYLSFQREKIREVKLKKRLSDRDVARLERNERFEEMVAISYAAHFIARFGTLVLSHLLWHFRTAFPPPSPGSKAATSCAFFGFEGEAGFEYMMCILQEMKTIRAKLSIHGRKIDKPVKRRDIEEHFRYWMRTLGNNYKNALKRRMTLEADLERFRKLRGSRRQDREEEEYDWTDENAGPIPESFVSDLYKAWKAGDGVAVNNFFDSINRRTKHLAFTFRTDLEEVLKEVGTDDKPQYVETTCCEQKNKKNLDFVEFYEEFKPDVPKIAKELAVLQNQMNLLKMRQLGTQFAIRSVQPPIRNLNLYPIKVLDYPESFIKDMFMAYCHDGVSKGEYHNFQNTEFEDITRCVKCGWFKNKLEKSEFSREQFATLINDVFKNTLVSLPAFEEIQKNPRLVSMKREASKNLQNDSRRLASRLARVLVKSGKEESESATTKRIETFLMNMDKFSMYMPDESKDKGDKIVVEAMNKRAYFAQQKMKEYINNFLRKDISRVAHGYKPKVADLPWLSGKELERWQQRLLDKKLWLEPFLTKSNRKMFGNFKFDYTAKEVTNIYGVTDVYGPEWKWILRPSLFSPSDAIKVLKHYFVIQISLFLDIAGAGEPIFAEFITKIFDNIEKDRQVLNVPKKEMTRWEDTRTEERVLMWARYYDAIREEDALLFNAPYRRFTEDVYEDPFAPKKQEMLTVDDDAFEKEVNKADRDSYLESKAKEELGDDATEQAIQSFVQDAIEEDEVNEEVEEEVYDNPILKEGEEIMDIGTEYGQLPQGTETAGDGFNEYTMTEAWDPVHEPDVLGEGQ